MQGFIDLVVYAIHDGSNASHLQPTTATEFKSIVHRALEICTFACAFSRPSSGRQAGSSNTVSSVTGQSMVCWMDEGCWVNEGHRVGQEVHNGDKLNHARGCKTSQQATPLKVIRQQATLLCQKIIHHVSEGVFHLHPKNLNRMAWDRWHALLCPSF